MERPRSLLAAAALVAIQAAVLGAWGTIEVVRSIIGHPHDRETALLLGIVVLIYAIGVAVAAIGLWRASRAAQTPSFMVSFFAVVVGVGQVHTLPGLMIPLIAIGVATFVALFMPASREALGGI